MSRESYAHKLAKETLRDWLVGTGSVNRDTCLAAVSVAGNEETLAWRHNRGSPYGVYMEYPIDHGTCWDEAGKEYSGDQGVIPTLEEYIRDYGTYPKAIYDIAIQHKGWISHAFEVVWKSDVSDRKLAVLQYIDITVYTVSAHWILSQTGVPERIKCDRRIEGTYTPPVVPPIEGRKSA